MFYWIADFKVTILITFSCYHQLEIICLPLFCHHAYLMTLTVLQYLITLGNWSTNQARR